MKTIYATELKTLFEPVLSLYSPSDSGDSLAYRIDEDWEIFSNDLDTDDQNLLLDEIRLGGMCPKDRSVETVSDDLWAENIDRKYSSRGSQWFEFSYHIRHERRFLLAPSSDSVFSDPKEWLPEYLPHITKIIKPDKILFRARRGGVEDLSFEGMRPYAADQMSAPPQNKTRCGRANPPGIPYLYTADSELTAVGEIRPYVGGRVTVAFLHAKMNLRVADLTKLHYVGSAFETDLREQIDRNGLLNILNRELSKPIVPEESEILYVPCQYLSEVILNAGFDGILYSSSISSKGNNLVFFDPNSLKIDETTKLVRIGSATVSYDEIDCDDQLL